MDPVRFRFMEALERRAAPGAGAARALLDQRLAALLDAYAADLERTRPRPAAPRPSRRKRLATRRDCAADTPIDAPLPADTLASLARALDTGHAVPGATPTRSCRCWTCTVTSGPRSAPTASCANRNSRCPTCRPAQFQQPGSPLAGADAPASPGYLHQFLSYLDALAWMEQFDGAVTAAREAARGSAKAGAGRAKTAKPAAAKRSRAKTA